MRFAAVIPPKPPPRKPATELIQQQGANSEPQPQVQSACPAAPETPPDLDQRVRLVGEW